MADISKIQVEGVNYDIKDAVARTKIGDLGALTTENTGDLVSAINEVAGKSCGITFIESASDNPVILRELESGTYVLCGRFLPYTGSTSSISFSSNLLVNIITKTAGTHVQVFYPVNNVIQFLNITDESYERTDIKLNELGVTASVDENKVLVVTQE